MDSTGNNIELFTIISLMIGLFGGTYSVIAFIVSEGNKKITKDHDTCKSKAESIKTISGEEAYNEAKKSLSKLCSCRTTWKFVQIAAILVFAGWSFFATVYVAIQSHTNNIQISWIACRWIMFSFVGINILYFIFASYAYWLAGSSIRNITAMHLAAVGANKPDLNIQQ